ncbi:uncharacterized protein N7500_006955 [Penicillium coprophilum]|uniref:uncharacterized protein n=1 Tax=Penicillium coprophilum TaxID=36646 RepID=UPI0023A71831|nr:uncharacterized protein N7500_006955 [Penicillium coprophilum]KAJ5165125.1 hypothetical protein N7500_006955 [Penicillium coprophilum]
MGPKFGKLAVAMTSGEGSAGFASFKGVSTGFCRVAGVESLEDGAKVIIVTVKEKTPMAHAVTLFRLWFTAILEDLV